MADSDIPKWNLWARLDPGLRPLVLIFLIITTCYALVFNEKISENTDVKPIAKPELPTYDLAMLTQNLASDPEKVLKKIYNQPTAVKGLVLDIGQDMFSPPYLLIAEAATPEKPALRCEFNIAYKRTLSKLDQGQEVTIAGTWHGQMHQSIPLFTQCRLQ